MRNCKCEYCGSAEHKAEMAEKENAWIEQHGFYMHLVPDADPPNVHTHGLVHSMNHIDLQIAMPLKAQLLATLIHDIVDKIRDGAKIKDGDILDYVLKDYNVKAVQMTEMGRPVIRILLPDKDGAFPDDDACAENFKIQMRREKL